MPVNFFLEDISFNLKNKRIIKKWINEVIQLENSTTGSINYIFTSDNNLLRINKEYLNHDYFTDIITFNYCEKQIINGDIFISVETVENNSTRFSVSFSDELNRVIIHGVLHLLGYNDQTDAEKQDMRQKENYYLDRLKKLF